MFSFGGDDDDADFTPSGQGGLKSLFGGGDGASQSLKFNAPKQPKPSPDKAKETSGVKFAVAAQTYHYQNNIYNPKGKLGVAVTNSNSVMIYGAKQRVLSNCQINANTAFSVTEKNFVSFYDDTQNCWGVMFDSEEEISKFLCMVTISKSMTVNMTIKQDLCKVSNTDKIATIGSTITVSYIGWILDNGNVGRQFDANTCYMFKLGAGNVIKGWNEALVGCHEGREYFIVIPPSSAYGSNGKPGLIPPNSVLSFKITITNIKVEEPPPSPSAVSSKDALNVNDITDSSSLESLPVQSRPGDNSGKIDIISRMAKMGAHPAFPGMEPSSPDIDPRSRSSSTRSNRSKRKPSRADSTQSVETKPIIPAKPGPLVPHGMINGNYNNYPIPQQFSQVYSSPIPQTAPPEIKEALDVSKNMHHSIQSIDSTIKSLEYKIDSLHQKTLLFSNTVTATPSLDTQVLMYNIQRLVTENDNLKCEMKEKNKQIENQCEKVTQLLDKNQKLMHLKNEAMEKTQNNFMANSHQSAQQITTLEEEKEELTRELRTLRSESGNRRFEEESKNSHIASLKAQIENLYSENMKLQSSVFETRNEFAAFKMSSSSLGGQEEILKNELVKMKNRMDVCLVEKLELSQKLDDEKFSQKEVHFQYRGQISRLEKELGAVKLQLGEDVIAKKYEDKICSLQMELSLAGESIKQMKADCERLENTVQTLEASSSENTIQIDKLSSSVQSLSSDLAHVTTLKDEKVEEIKKLSEQISSTEFKHQTEVYQLKLQATPNTPASSNPPNPDLERKILELKSELEEVKSGVNGTVKKIINKVFLTFRKEVNIDNSYTGRSVLQLAMRIIKQVTLDMMREEESESESDSEDEHTSDVSEKEPIAGQNTSHMIPIHQSNDESDSEVAGPSNHHDDQDDRYNTPPSESVTFELPQNTALNDFLSPEVAQDNVEVDEIPHFSPEPANRDTLEDLHNVLEGEIIHDVIQRDIHDVILGGDIVPDPEVLNAAEEPGVPDVANNEAGVPDVANNEAGVPDDAVNEARVPDDVANEAGVPDHAAQEFFPDLEEEELWVQAPTVDPPSPSPASFEPNVTVELEDDITAEVFGARPEAVQVSPPSDQSALHRYNRPPPLFSDSEDDDLGFLS